METQSHLLDLTLVYFVLKYYKSKIPDMSTVQINTVHTLQLLEPGGLQLWLACNEYECALIGPFYCDALIYVLSSYTFVTLSVSNTYLGMYLHLNLVTTVCHLRCQKETSQFSSFCGIYISYQSCRIQLFAAGPQIKMTYFYYGFSHNWASKG